MASSIYGRRSADLHPPASAVALAAGGGPVSEAGSNPSDSVTLTNGGDGRSSGATPTGQPLLRRNQYWV